MTYSHLDGYDKAEVDRRIRHAFKVRFPQQFAGTNLYKWVERGTLRVKCLAQQHNTMYPARARTQTARSEVERTNHEATDSQYVPYLRVFPDGNGRFSKTQSESTALSRT